MPNLLYSDAWIYKNRIIYNELNRNGWLACGFDLKFADLQDAKDRHLDKFADSVKIFLDSVSIEERVQIKFYSESHYPELDDYNEKTKKCSKDRRFTRHIRDMVYNNFKIKEENNELKRKFCRIYFTRKIDTKTNLFGITGKIRRTKAESIACSMDAYFDQKLDHISKCFGYDCSVRRLNDQELIKDFAKVLSPAIADEVKFENFNFSESVFTNFSQSSAFFRFGKLQYGFSYDGRIHDVLVFKNLPLRCRAEDIFKFTNFSFNDYSVTVNITPVDIEKQIDEDETAAKNIQGDLDSSKHQRLIVDLDNVNKRIADMQSGRDSYFDVTFIFCVSSYDMDTLITKSATLKKAIKTFGGARYWEELQPCTAWKLYLQTLPGWVFSRYKNFRLKVSSEALSRILPLNSSFTGFLEDADVLMDGDNREVVGIKFFFDGTPQLGAMFGKTRSGKSFNTISFLVQSDVIFDYTAIIDEGNSYGLLVELMGCKSIIFRKDSQQIINPFDLNGHYLSNEHISFLTAFLSKMCGIDSDDTLRRRRISILDKFTRETYAHFVNDFRENRPDKYSDTEKMAYVIAGYHREYMNSDSDFIEAWVDVRDILNGNIENQEAYVRLRDMTVNIDESSFSDFLLDDTNKQLVNNIALSYFSQNEYPTLNDLLTQIELSEEYNSRTDNIVKETYDLLEPWANTMFNGCSNIPMNQDYDHFELGKLGDDAEDEKALIVLYVHNVIRGNILNRPRSSPKRVIFEERRRFSEIPGAVKFQKEIYGQMAKFNTYGLFITQQYGDGMNLSDVRTTILGNASQLFIMMQKDIEDLKDIQKVKQLSDVTCDRILKYPPVSHLPKNDKHSRFTYYQESFPADICGTCRNYVPPEMAFVATTTGREYEKRRELLKGEKDLFEAVLKHSVDFLHFSEDDSGNTNNKRELSA